MSPSQFRLARIAGLGICLTLLLLRSLLLLQSGVFLREMRHASWLLPMGCFAAALWLNSTAEERTAKARVVLLGLQSLSLLTMAFMMGGMKAGNYIGYLLLIVTWQLALTVPVRIAIFWIIGQTVTLALAFVFADHAGWITASLSVILKCVTYVIVLTLKREADARAEYAALNAEMLATREFLAERSRTNERLRISRDLHDVLGHYLTALSLNLEIALHKEPVGGREELLQAQAVTKHLLEEVRGVVSAMRFSEDVDLENALRSLARGFLPVVVHLEIPSDLRCCDPSRAEVLVRCAQELITNAVKHARARQVWIELKLLEGVLRIQSHDDGHSLSSGKTSLGTGLTSMRERFEHFGGRIQVLSGPEGGFTLTGFLPMLPGIIRDAA